MMQVVWEHHVLHYRAYGEQLSKVSLFNYAWPCLPLIYGKVVTLTPANYRPLPHFSVLNAN